MASIFPNNGITVLDKSMDKGDIRFIKSLEEYLGFKLINETGEHLYIEVEFGNLAHYPVSVVSKLTIRK